jgi:hypothetical protein
LLAANRQLIAEKDFTQMVESLREIEQEVTAKSDSVH